MMRAPVFFMLLSAAAAANALNVSDPRRFECKQGDCMNGQGVVWDALLSVRMQGNWAGGHTIPGATYTVIVPIAPNKQFKQVYGQDGMLDSGDQPRSIGGFNGVVPFFRGSYGRITHAFLRQPVAVIKQGVYDSGIGIEYRGRFEYLAAKSGMNTGWGSGFYIFYGDKIDTEENEKETGLFVSDETMGGAAVRFVKADPSYLAVMQKKYQQDMQIAQGEFKQQESENGWRTALAILGKVAFTMAAGNTGLGGNGNGLSGNLATNLLGGNAGAASGNVTGDIAMNLVSSMFNSGGSAPNVKEFALQAIGSAVGGDKQQTRALINAVSDGIKEAGGAAAGQPALARAPGTSNAAAKPSSTGSTVVDAFAGAMINRTTNVIATAVTGGKDTAGIGQLGTALLKQAITSHTQAAVPVNQPTIDPSEDPGTVQLPYTPGKGFLDAVTGKYIKTMEEMSCDNVTARGTKVRDLPAARRTCVETDQSSSAAPNAALARMAVSTASDGKAKKAAGSAPLPSKQSTIGNITKIAPPDGLQFTGGLMYATNDGVYLAASGADGHTVVAKRTVGRGSVSGWLTATLPKGSATFAVSSLAPEDPDAFGIQWVTYLDRYGYINMNNNGTSADYKNATTSKHGVAYAFVPIGAKSKRARNWVIGQNSIFLKSTGGDRSTDFGDNFDPMTEPGQISYFKDLATTDEEGTTLYIPGADLKTLVQINSSRSVVPYDLSPFGDGMINTLIAAYGKLWIGYGDQVLTLSGGKIKPFARMKGIFPTTKPAFCLAGPTMYTADGQMIQGVDISPSSPRSFLKNPARVRPEDMQTLIETRTALLTGLYCAYSAGYGPVIYALGSDLGAVERKLFAIRP